MPLAGFIKLHRSLLEWEWHDDPTTGWLFVNLILMANFSPSEWKGRKIERGQLVTGRKALSVQTGLSEQMIRTSLNHLKNTGEITIKSTNKFSLITVVNYEKFQSDADEPTSNLTSNQPATNQQLTTTEEEKEERERKKVRKRFSPPSVDEVSAYCQERGNTVDAQTFCNFYASKGWRVGSQPMRDWKAAVRTWEKRDGGREDRRIGRRSDPFGGYGAL